MDTPELRQSYAAMLAERDALRDRVAELSAVQRSATDSRSLNDLERYLREECLCEICGQCESCNWLQDLIALRRRVAELEAAPRDTITLLEDER